MEENYNSDSDSDNEHDNDFKNINTNTIVAIDTCESMFEPSSLQNNLLGFQVALKALHKVNDGLIFSNTTRNKVAALTFHENSSKRVIMDFETPFKEGLMQLKYLAEAKLNVLEEFKVVKSNFSFGLFLMEMLRMFKQVPRNNIKQIYFITNNPDPCFADPKLKFQALQGFKDLKELGIKFDILLLSDDFDLEPFYREAYEILEKTPPKFYYDFTYLTSTISAAIKSKSAVRNLKIYYAKNCDKYINCKFMKYAKPAKLLRTKHITRDLKQEVRSVVVKKGEPQYKLQLGTEEKIFSKEERDKLLKTDYMVGLTIVHALEERLSVPGVNMSSPVLISAKNSEDRDFIAFWEAAVRNNFRLIGMLKHKEGSRVHSVELTPKLVYKERQFLMINMPHSLNMKYPEYEEEKVVKNDDVALLEELISKTTIENYDLTKIRPFKYVQQIKYFKKELLGAEYDDGTEFIDLVNDELFSDDYLKTLEKLDSIYKVEHAGKGKRTKAERTKATKRCKV